MSWVGVFQTSLAVALTALAACAMLGLATVGEMYRLEHTKRAAWVVVACAVLAMVFSCVMIAATGA